MAEMKFVGTPKKATTHVNQNEGLVFESGDPTDIQPF
jgi:glycine dehydrogenase subunit 2